MGTWFSKLFDKLSGIKEVRLLMLGLDNAGKTTILHRLKYNDDVITVPTVGFNSESLMVKNVKFNVWDVGGQNKLRPLWRHYYTGTQALIFVVDSSDRDRIDEARQELHRIMKDREMRDCLLLIFANKTDMTGAMTDDELAVGLHLQAFLPERWSIQRTCGLSGDGLYEGLDWLVGCFNTASASRKTSIC